MSNLESENASDSRVGEILLCGRSLSNAVVILLKSGESWKRLQDMKLKTVLVLESESGFH